MTRASFQWTAEREGNIGIITEYRPDGTSATWRIHSFLVPAFLRARRNLINWKMRNLMSAEQVPDADYEYLKEPHNDVLQSSNSRLDSNDPRRWGAEPFIPTPDD